MAKKKTRKAPARRQAAKKKSPARKKTGPIGKLWKSIKEFGPGGGR
jgi:hypothetical protein